jgi:hypothetical protein
MGHLHIAALLLFFSWHLEATGMSTNPFAAADFRAQFRGASEDSRLRDSELVYEISGGFAGLGRRAALASAEGKIAVEYRSEDPGRVPSQQSSILSPKEYLALWRELERNGLWTLKVREAAEVRTEVVRHTLRARVGAKVQEITWTEPNTTSAGRAADSLGNKILEVARRSTLGRHNIVLRRGSSSPLLGSSTCPAAPDLVTSGA